MNTELNTELNTPRTDAQAGWAIANQYGQSTGSELLGDPDGVFVHAVFARTLERELAESRNAERLARVQLGNEREKVKRLVEINEFVGSAQLKAEREKVLALRLACERIVAQWDKNHDAAPFHAGNVMYSRASAALAATEDTKT
jgi:hypothetical protein